LSRRQLTGLPASSSNDLASDQGQRAGTQSAGFGAEAYEGGRQQRRVTQNAHILIFLIYDGQGGPRVTFGMEGNELDCGGQ